MWQRLTKGRAGSAGASESGDKRLQEATNMLDRLETGLEVRSRGQERTASSEVACAQLHDYTLFHCVRCILAIPKGSDRDKLIERLRGLLDRILLEGSTAKGDWSERALSALSCCSECDVLQNAVSQAFASLERDAEFDRQKAIIHGPEQIDKDDGSDGAATALLARLAAGVQVLSTLDQHCIETNSTRRRALEESASLLAEKHEDLQSLANDAMLRYTELQQKAEAAGSCPDEYAAAMDQEGGALEREVNRLEELKKQLRASLDSTSMRHDDALARQKAHMTQVDCWRLDKDKVNKTAKQSRQETLQACEAAQHQEESCNTFVSNLKEVQHFSATENETDCFMQTCTQNIQESATLIHSATEERLRKAKERAIKILDEHRRAKETLELLEVKDTAGHELPTMKALSQALATLQDAWASRTTLGCVDLKQRAELEAFLQDASRQTTPGLYSTESLAETKALWAKHWAEFGDLGGEPLVAAVAQSCFPADGLVHLEPPTTASKSGVLPCLDDEGPLLG
eukprot:TRINITY_DN94808_c0_g1_i1.p1 TRINITY_DN94808_c0_g1~~TRINITY_DN94808_c0_g1_i1.p1  ORF type:complete len:517 (+),score=102.56 TRINITY_DN94808_c0_g1_i1:72-1622(+)